MAGLLGRLERRVLDGSVAEQVVAAPAAVGVRDGAQYCGQGGGVEAAQAVVQADRDAGGDGRGDPQDGLLGPGRAVPADPGDRGAPADPGCVAAGPGLLRDVIGDVDAAAGE